MVKFGTSGHRGIIHTSFTVEDVKAIAQAVSVYLRRYRDSPKIVIGYDSRTGNDPLCGSGSFTGVLVETLVTQGVSVYFCSEPTPTPVISWAIEAYGFDGGLILTASHNPPEYNGLKFNPSNGAPAPESITAEIESLANHFLVAERPPFQQKGSVVSFEAKLAFAQHVLAVIQTLTTVDLRGSGLSLVLDTKYGACGAQWQTFLSVMASSDSDILHEKPDATFRGISPNPTDKASLTALAKRVVEIKAPLAIANDPDGDRHVVLDELGQFVSPEELTCIVLHFLKRHGLALDAVGTTLASSRIVTQTAALLGIPCVETKVGFKYFAPILETARAHDALAVCVESSGGFTVSSHTLEKCGFLPGLLVAAIALKEKKSISQLKQEILAAVPSVVFREIQKDFSLEARPRLVAFFETFSLSDATSFSQPIVNLSKEDGLKLTFASGDWVLMRLSGTEPVMRLYAESGSEVSVDQVLRDASECINRVLR